MKELTFGELKQGLLCCTVYKNCSGCPLYMGGDLGTASAGDLTCTGMLMAAALNCINVMKKDLADAVKSADMWKEQAENWQEAMCEKF
jgi:hypothetical protein